MKPSEPFQIASPTRMQTTIKRVVMFLYRDGLISSRVVLWAFDRFNLKDA